MLDVATWFAHSVGWLAGQTWVLARGTSPTKGFVDIFQFVVRGTARSSGKYLQSLSASSIETPARTFVACSTGSRNESRVCRALLPPLRSRLPSSGSQYLSVGPQCSSFQRPLLAESTTSGVQTDLIFRAVHTSAIIAASYFML